MALCYSTDASGIQRIINITHIMPPLISWGSTSSVYPNCSRKNLIKVALVACLSWSSWNWASNGYLLHLDIINSGIISYPAVWKQQVRAGLTVLTWLRFLWIVIMIMVLNTCKSSYFICLLLVIQNPYLLRWKSLIKEHYLTQIAPTKPISITACHGVQQFQ